jgi:molybdate transport system regulatory protein
MLSPRFRIFHRDEIALGPGKVELLKAIQKTGSIRQAALNLQMSYMRAWLLVRTMNQCFKEPLVIADRGGSAYGGAKLTPTGVSALELYERLEAESIAATQATQRELEKLLNPLSPKRG